MIYLSPPDVGPAEEAAVLRALSSGWVAPLGPEVDGFESELADFTGRRHAAAVSSGTAALHLILTAMGVGPGDVVVTATMTFIATANAIVYTGATPVFVDCDETGNMSPELLEEALAAETAAGRRVRAVIPVDLLGKVADYARLTEVASRYGVPVVSDAAEALGASRDGRPAGSFGVSAAVSFNGNKIMTTSGGGAVLTDDAELVGRVRYLATQARQPAVHYEHTEIGYNYRMSNLLAALGRAQLERLPEMITRRRRIRASYRDFAAGVAGLTVFGDVPGTPITDDEDNCWLTAFLVDEDVTGWGPGRLIATLAEQGIESRPLWKPMHQQPVFAGARAYLGGTSDLLFERGVTLPSGSVLSDADQERVLGLVGTIGAGS